MKKRSSLSRGIVSAIKAVQRAESDPFAEVDDPMSTSEAVEALLEAEGEIQSNREILLKDSVSSAEAATLIGRSRQSVERLRRDGRFLALRVGSQWRYPRWQFEPDAPGAFFPDWKRSSRTSSFLQPVPPSGSSSPRNGSTGSPHRAPPTAPPRAGDSTGPGAKSHALSPSSPPPSCR